MKKTKIYYILILILLLYSFRQYTKYPCVIYWKPDMKLKWEYFKDSVPEWALHEQTEIKQQVLAEIEPYCEVIYLKTNKYKCPSVLYGIDTCNSWAYLKDVYGLEHEEGHFYIGLLYALKLQKVLNEMYKSDLYKGNPIFFHDTIQYYFSKANESDVLFDKKTIGGMMITIQNQWRDSIFVQVNKLLTEGIKINKFE
jgi:hypothetical protein